MADPRIVVETYNDEFTKHLLGLGWRTNAPGSSGMRITPDERLIVTSGFLASYRGVWLFITAGHILESLEQLVDAGFKAYQFRVFDGLKISARHREPIPFDYRRGKTWYIHSNDGVDFGIVIIPELQRLLEKNGMDPISFESHCFDVPDQYDDVAMVGLPTVSERLDNAGDRGWTATISPTLIQVADIPMTDVPSAMITGAPRWYGQLPPLCKNEEDSASASLADIDGMSGGPVIGIKKQPDGSLRYWVIGVQSAWHRPTRIIAVTPLRLIKSAVDEYLKWIAESPELQAEVERKALEEMNRW